jgi:hyperosmotically inducible protein
MKASPADCRSPGETAIQQKGTEMRTLDQIVILSLVAGLLSLAAATADAPSDAWLTTKAKIAIFTSIGAKGTSVHVDTVNGKMTLHGKVASRADKESAEKTARGIDGVKEIRNLLQVVSAAEEDRVEKSDAIIQKDVEAALSKDGALKQSSVSVRSVNKGTVLLGGKTESLSAHLRAIETARSVAGVRSVRSEIESPDAKADTEIWRNIGGMTEKTGSGLKSAAGSLETAMTDVYITATTKMRLFANKATPGLDINVDTDDGVVTLFGSVPTAAAKATAEAEAQKVSGVKRVINELQVVPSGQRAQVSKRDSELETEALKALDDDPNLRNVKINVEVRDGVARLTGTVLSESAKLAAVAAVQRVDGIRSVQDDVKVAAD